jgi:hypothetical protein
LTIESSGLFLPAGPSGAGLPDTNTQQQKLFLLRHAEMGGRGEMKRAQNEKGAAE